MTRWLEQQTVTRVRRGLDRSLLPRTSTEDCIDLASNDYLGLANHPCLVQAAREAAGTWGTGATSSRLVAGTTELHTQLENALAALTGIECGLVYSSGYLANIGVIVALGGPGTLIVADSHCHASMIDGLRLSRSRTETFTHNAVDGVARLLADRSEPRALIAVESIYSVLGDEAPLLDLFQLAEQYDAMLLIDEAHSLGVMGGGRGSVAGTPLAGHPRVIVTATLSKALGSQGGAVLASEQVRDHLINRSRTFMFDTGLAPMAAAAALAAITIIVAEPWRVAMVHTNAITLVDTMTRIVNHDAMTFAKTVGAVQSIRMPDAGTALSSTHAAFRDGVRVGCFRPPSVPDGISRLRITARATLKTGEINRACSVLGAILEGVL
jgi:8-amino-7-oxononanoate synthase